MSLGEHGNKGFFACVIARATFTPTASRPGAQNACRIFLCGRCNVIAARSSSNGTATPPRLDTYLRIIFITPPLLITISVCPTPSVHTYTRNCSTPVLPHTGCVRDGYGYSCAPHNYPPAGEASKSSANTLFLRRCAPTRIIITRAGDYVSHV